MIHRPSDSRLLNNLLSHEKDYSKHLSVLLDHSHATLASFSAFASALAPPLSQVINAVAGSLSGADDALTGYAAAVEQWQEQLKALRSMEDDVGNIVRDREILVTRLIKASKSQKSAPREPVLAGPSSPSVSSLSISKPELQLGQKLSSAQAQLQACEAHLAAKEQELSAFRVHAIRSGLHARCKAMVECGWVWGEMGKEAMRALENLDMANDYGSPSMHPDVRSSVNDKSASSDVSSIAPSQSASQIGIISPGTHTPSTLHAPSPPPQFPSTSQSYTLHIPPAHSISEYAVPNGTARPATIMEEQTGSSDEGEVPSVQVHENPRFAKGKSSVPSRHVSFSIRKHNESSSVRSESPTKKRGMLGSLAALFHVGNSRSSDVGAPLGASPSKADSRWRTRIDHHLASAQRGDSSDDEPVLGSPSQTDISRLKKRAKRGSVQTPGSSRMASPDRGYASDTITESMSKNARTKNRRKRSASKPPMAGGSARSQEEVASSSGGRLKKAQGSALSPNSSVSKQSMTSAVSAPALATGRATTEPRRRTASLNVQPPKPSSAHKRTGSVSASTVATNADGQPSLMSIVEGISRLNREASLKQNPDRMLVVPKAPGRINIDAYSETLSELPLVKAPPQPQVRPPVNGSSPSLRPRIKRAQPEQDNNYRNSLLLSGSVSAPSLPLSGSTSVTAAGAINQARTSNMSKPLPSSPKLPLRSALRNSSRSPSPSTVVKALPRNTDSYGSPLAHHTTTIHQPMPTAASDRPTTNRRESDVSSISSYETGHEVLVGSDEEDRGSPALPPIPMPVPALNGNGHAVPNGHAHPQHQDGSDLSHSTVSTVQTYHAHADTQEGEGAEPPRRRKSVRMSLPPTFSATPPALDDTDEEAAQEGAHAHAPWASSPPRQPAQRSGWGTKIEASVGMDMWEDSDEEEDAEYSAAKRLLAKVAGGAKR